MLCENFLPSPMRATHSPPRTPVTSSTLFAFFDTLAGQWEG
jgi:hypothetical protein